ncbi:transcription-repair coupling factor [Yunchengibacter salinarum]|uniref:transcription-repair coupling factor n=1 Tax=Yunchengibacter salinarum TaxID=3133399 RepID=UPI0035B64D87
MSLDALINAEHPLTVAGVPGGFDAWLLTRAAAEAHNRLKKPVLHITRDDRALSALIGQVAFFDPALTVLDFPAWDCLPYDRVSPQADITARRMETLSRLAAGVKGPALILTTVNAVLQRVPPKEWVAAASLGLAPGDQTDMTALTDRLHEAGYSRSDQVMEPGEYAVRGGLLDLYPTGAEEPVRLDFFGDELDSIRRFDPLSQRTTGRQDRVNLKPAAEFSLDPESRQRFQRAYVNTFGPAKGEDPLFEAVGQGRALQGAEHWLPFFHDRMDSLFDYVDSPVLTMDHQADIAADERLKAVQDHFEARQTVLAMIREGKDTTSPLYKPCPPGLLFLTGQEWESRLLDLNARHFSPNNEPENETTITMKARRGRDFAPERNDRAINIYDAVRAHVVDLRKAGRRVVFACTSAGAAQRMETVLKDHGVAPIAFAESWAAIRRETKSLSAVTVLPADAGFETDDLALLTEQDILGDRLVRKVRRQRRADNFLSEASALSPGDLVVHTQHGIGRFDRLEAVEVNGAAHDCLALVYHGGDRLFVPVENIEVLSRYGGETTEAQLDKLGGVAWQARKAKMKERIREMADQLIKLAAQREMREGTRIAPPEGLYEEFAARFPFEETDDQLRAISDVAGDLASGRPMDRLICGDVGFGKTEVALRAAFLAVMAGHQVAVIAPTTLLARQHYQTFEERFRDLPVKVAQLSRLVSQKNAKATRAELADGTADIVIGTHALLGKGISFRDLGLLIVDEEQHFGVAHKERLKELKADVHVLTMTATPIPRTLQMAMSGIRDLSIIATPPVDRLAVRTFVLPFDPVVVREALLREHFRGGQSFYVCPYVADLQEAATFLKDHVPEVKFTIAHGQMPAREIEDVMTAFYEGRFDVLLSTTIIESGIDIPTANTMVVHRSDRFGLAQLYQLRGRVGRAKMRAYAYLTVPPRKALSENADKRLQVLQTLDTLGAGFNLASHDMDIRGAGNLLGEEQSGHVREVGVELYQKMLEEAVSEARAGGADDSLAEDWSPQINVGATVMIPESYVPDLNTRMALYRRLADLTTREDVDAFAAELIDRFGPLPGAVKQLAHVMIIKGHCKRAGIEKLEAGPKGMTISFYKDSFPNPAGLVDFISRTGATAKLKPDHKLVYLARMESVVQRLKSVNAVVKQLASLAEKAPENA